ncbi:MAG: purine-binding chemotaxis protein CheW [Candidatus Eisenbacteria bacterium]|nr:purine-binding chemotaxis protein CheW [Candidatus Eisenbacteria bacterium]
MDEATAAIQESASAQGTVEIDVGAQLAGKYMTFKLAAEEYGLEILKVREIIGLMDITEVPRTADFIRGVINLRGKVIPVVDLRLKFGMPKAEATDQTVIIVVQYSSRGQDVTMGILVDEVMEVMDIPAEQIDPPPSFGSNATDTEFILGVGKAEKRVIFLLEIGKVLSTDEVTDLVANAGASA